ncbi:MAG: hypothetical protein M1820_000179 [Bogoriella megaspora]|nr:MAG: hypothetical protein M1820_000179 [Bogoriella megaspora]
MDTELSSRTSNPESLAVPARHFYFLRLPPEIRLMIYELLPPPEDGFNLEVANDGLWPRLEYTPPDFYLVHLVMAYKGAKRGRSLGAFQELRAEVLSALLKKHTPKIHAPNLPRFLTGLNEQPLRSMTHLHIVAGAAKDLGRNYSNHEAAIEYLAQRCPKLKHLHTWVPSGYFRGTFRKHGKEPMHLRLAAMYETGLFKALSLFRDMYVFTLEWSDSPKRVTERVLFTRSVEDIVMRRYRAELGQQKGCQHRHCLVDATLGGFEIPGRPKTEQI